MNLGKKISLWYKAMCKKRWQRTQERYREAHRNGHNCGACCLRIESNGRLWRPVRSMIFFCEYDIPERANKLRHDMSAIRKYESIHL